MQIALQYSALTLFATDKNICFFTRARSQPQKLALVQEILLIIEGPAGSTSQEHIYSTRP